MLSKIISIIENCSTRFWANIHSNKKIGRHTSMRKAKLAEYVSIGSRCEISHSEIGKYTYIGGNTKLPFAEIGAYCSIAPDVQVIVGNHPSDFVSTSPATYSTKGIWKNKFISQDVYESEYVYTDERKKFLLKIGNDVWIASRATLVCGKKALEIGDGAIIRGGALVTKDVPPYAIVQGCPAKIVGYRFEKEEIDKLLKIKWWEKDEEWMRKYIGMFKDIKQFISNIEKEN